MNKELLDKVVSLHTEIGKIDKSIKMLEANLADLQAELNKYDIVNSVPTTRASDSPDFYWAKYVATHKDGLIYAYEVLPTRWRMWWHPQSSTMFERITPEQAIALCNVIPQWEDEEPTPVVNR